MAANNNGDNITAGNTNHCDAGTELISRGDGYPTGNDYVLQVSASPIAGIMYGLKVFGNGQVIVDPQGQTFLEGGGAWINGAAGPGVIALGGDVGVSGTASTTGVAGNGRTAGVSGAGASFGVIGQGALGVLGGGDQEGVRGAGQIGVNGFGAAVGVQGQSTSGNGVVGVTTGVMQGGVVGISNSSRTAYGVVGKVEAPAGASGLYGAAGIQGEAALTADGKNYQGWAGSFIGPVFCGGELIVFEGNFTVIGGAKSAAAPHPDGSYRRLYATESPESWFEDFGEATLQNGVAHVALDADFMSLVHAGHYHVFVTPHGDCSGLFVHRRSREGFDVAESQGGKSNVAFSWRVVAKRKDIAGERFAKVELPRRPERSNITVATTALTEDRVKELVDKVDQAAGALAARPAPRPR